MKKDPPITVLALACSQIDLLRMSCEALQRAGHFHIHLLAGKGVRSLRYARWPASITVLPSDLTEDQVVYRLMECARRHKADVLLPIGINDAMIAANHRETIKKVMRCMCIPDVSLLEQLRSKLDFIRLMESLDFPVPHTLELTKFLQADQVTARVGCPLLAKPLVGGGGNGIQSLQDQEALKTFLSDPQQASGMLLQETVPGEDVALTLLADQGRVFAVMLRKVLYRRRHHSAFMPFVDMEFFHNDWLEALGRRFVTLTEFSGIADFDLKVDFSAQRAWFLECDPRMMASVEAAQIFGLNVPYLLIMNAMGKLPPDACIRTEEGNYLTSKSFLECLLRNRWPNLKHKPLRTNFRNKLTEPLNTAAHLGSTVCPPRIKPVS